MSPPKFPAFQTPQSNDPKEISACILDMGKKINQLSANIPSGPPVLISPLSASPPRNVTFTLPSGSSGWLPVYIPASYLVAASGGPYVLTITSGSGSVVQVPIIKNGDTLLSGNLFFWVYVDASGNVTSDAWSVKGSNTNGAYEESMDGSATLTGSGSTTITPSVYGVYYGITWVITPPIILSTIDYLSIVPKVGTPDNGAFCGSVTSYSVSAPAMLILYYNNSAGTQYVNFEIIGRWR
jgi:hypothetical protein